LLFFLFTALFARYCIFKIVFSYSAIQPQVCLINSVSQILAVIGN